MTATHVLDGVTVPLVTVMGEPGIPSAEKAQPLLEALADAGVSSLMLLGSNGEGALLPTEKIGSYIRGIAERWRRVQPDGKIVINVSAQGTMDALRRAEIALEASPDALVVSPPSYFRHQEDEIISHIRAIESFGQPVVIYNVPNYANPLTATAFAALIESPLVVGMKDSSGDLDLLASFIAVSAGRADVGIAQGDETKLLQALQAGARGVVPGTGNISPALAVEVYKAHATGNIERAESAQAAMTALTGIHRVRRGVPSVKAVLESRGLIPAHASPPLAPCTPAEIRELEAFLAPFDEFLVPQVKER